MRHTENVEAEDVDAALRAARDADSKAQLETRDEDNGVRWDLVAQRAADAAIATLRDRGWSEPDIHLEPEWQDGLRAVLQHGAHAVAVYAVIYGDWWVENLGRPVYRTFGDPGWELGVFLVADGSDAMVRAIEHDDQLPDAYRAGHGAVRIVASVSEETVGWVGWCPSCGQALRLVREDAEEARETWQADAVLTPEADPTDWEPDQLRSVCRRCAA